MLAPRMKKKNVRKSGVHVTTHFDPTLGCEIESRTNSTTASSAFMDPVGTGRSCSCFR